MCRVTIRRSTPIEIIGKFALSLSVTSEGPASRAQTRDGAPRGTRALIKAAAKLTFRGNHYYF
jgi:hypothetical protein